jgi:phosphoesterase RecJ-like protein
MSIKADELKATRERLAEAEHIALISHVRPDGDAVCSVLAMGLALQAQGKEVQFLLSDGPGQSYTYLQGVDQFQPKLARQPDLLISVDAAARDRLGAAAGDLIVDINIDHHVTNTQFGVINLIDQEAVATCGVLAEHFPALGLEISQPVADALMVGLLTDTLGFRTSNMTPKALRVAADLMEAGADLAKLYHQSLSQRSFEAIRYWGAGLSHLQREDGLVWASLSLEDRKAARYPGNDDAELVNVMSTIEDADLVVLFVQQSSDEVKISWRSEGHHDVSRIASQFGGGGHKPAAGAQVSGSLDEAMEKVLSATRQAMGL